MTDAYARGYGKTIGITLQNATGTTVYKTDCAVSVIASSRRVDQAELKLQYTAVVSDESGVDQQRASQGVTNDDITSFVNNVNNIVQAHEYSSVQTLSASQISYVGTSTSTLSGDYAPIDTEAEQTEVWFAYSVAGYLEPDFAQAEVLGYLQECFAQCAQVDESEVTLESVSDRMAANCAMPGVRRAECGQESGYLHLEFGVRATPALGFTECMFSNGENSFGGLVRAEAARQVYTFQTEFYVVVDAYSVQDTVRVCDALPIPLAVLRGCGCAAGDNAASGCAQQRHCTSRSSYGLLYGHCNNSIYDNCILRCRGSV